jgi:hypothetical protein
MLRNQFREACAKRRNIKKDLDAIEAERISLTLEKRRKLMACPKSLFLVNIDRKAAWLFTQQTGKLAL